ncbi:MAG: hypothetical protein JSR65_00030 [Proteobacteria bacterium]|nr:hypothetical protein [Pseudomonadota bacterium]
MTISSRRFRQLVLTSVALNLIGAVADKFLAARIPDVLREAHEKQVAQAMAQFPTWAVVLYAIFGVASLVALVGLYRFKSWARTWSLVLPILGLGVVICTPSPYDYDLSSVVGGTLRELASMLDGAILAIAYFVPSIGARFDAAGRRSA